MQASSCRTAAGCLAAAAFIIAAACGGSKNPVTPAPVTCTYTVTAPGTQVPAAGQAITVHVDTAASCAWTARAGTAWVSLSATSGSGPADIVATVTANDDSAERVATLTVADKEVAVRQSGRTTTPSCSFALSSGSSTFGADGGRGHVTVQTTAGCAWAATALAPWITLRVASGSGPGEIEYDVAPFDGTAQRDTRIVVGQAFFAVRQDPPVPGPCTYLVNPTSTSLHWHGSPGDGFDVQVTTGARCSWTAAPGAPWIEMLSGAAVTGSGAARVRINAYTQSTTRSAPLMVRWPTDTAGQNVWITQQGCYYAISVTTAAPPAAGGRFRVSVFGTPVSVDCSLGCPWTAAANAPWLHIVGATSRAGDDDMSYDVDANTTGAPRTGTLTIAGITLTVTQGT